LRFNKRVSMKGGIVMEWVFKILGVVLIATWSIGAIGSIKCIGEHREPITNSDAVRMVIMCISWVMWAIWAIAR